MNSCDIRIAVLSPASIARSRFLPALGECDGVSFAGVACADEAERSAVLKRGGQSASAGMQRANDIADEFGGRVFDSFAAALDDASVDAVYIPLPPALHHYWAKRALTAGKHVLLEKPFTTTFSQAQELLELSRTNNLAICENYMFAYHAQLEAIKQMIARGAVGEVHNVRVDFGFPRRAAGDFRYCRAMGGGALLDCGGYVLKCATCLVGENLQVVAANSVADRDSDVDIRGSVSLVSDAGISVQAAFGMDEEYRCNLDVWGSEGSLFTGRILTAPPGFVGSVSVRRGGKEEQSELPADNAFARSIEVFRRAVSDADYAEQQRGSIEVQAALLQKTYDLMQGASV